MTAIEKRNNKLMRSAGFKIDSWLKKFIHANKGKRGVRVYYLMGSTGVICSDIAVSVSKGRVNFADGGWNPASSCYLTKGQCRRGTGEWMKDWRKQNTTDAINKAKRTVERAAEALKEADARLQEMIVSLDAELDS